MKVIIFSKNSSSDMEENINKFIDNLQENGVKKIIDIKYSIALSGGCLLYSSMIIYE
jgi:hypothetical protein